MRPIHKLLMAVTLVASVLAAFSIPAVGADKPRFGYCHGGASMGCKQPGRGYTMCEHFLKALNSLPPEEPQPVCDIKLPPGFEEFQMAPWEPMPVAENMRLIYDMEMYLVSSGKRDYSQIKWPQYFPDEYWLEQRSLSQPKTWRRVPYEIWLADYRERMRKGDIEPRLSRVRVTLNERGPQDLVRYERSPGGDAAACRIDVAKFRYGHGGSHIFAMTGNAELPINAIHGHGGSHSTAQLLLYLGKGVFVWTEGPDGWYLGLTVAMPPLPPHLPDDGQTALDTRCEFRLTK